MDYSQYNLEKTGYLKEDFRLFHINDQTKKDFSYHYHDFHKIIVFISGKVTYHIEGKAYHLKPRDILLVSQGAIHKPEIDPSVPYERYIFWIRDDLSCQELNTCFQKANDRSFNLVRADSALQERLKDLLPEIEQTLQNEHFGDPVLRDALFTQFMIYINRIFLRTSSSPDKKTYSSDTQVEQLLKYINRNLSENLSIDQLANRFFFSKYHMMRKFKNETGYTIHNYITSKRLLMARSLISQGMPVMKAAQASGFHDYTTFVRAYKKQFGKAPSCE
ncbi:AraC family transcriptional regulator [Blautia obeum]|jgi:AraC-like DNA-binding protein|uniref:AraC family transcriptional regulator n=1 Tax=Blautia obeum TaxID=40520 RepID=A0A454HH89_9FIRM|nr:AraC family transcriptional regulator [Blautia obeum]NSJ35698.1 AraC family transcriptional regulator [Blautia obeum]RGY07643.1 AraC family transcriptional regulator [Blautia obeum]RHC06850.1 AraC family transcriptional regulator [Blautia obeum]